MPQRKYLSFTILAFHCPRHSTAPGIPLPRGSLGTVIWMGYFPYHATKSVVKNRRPYSDSRTSPGVPSRPDFWVIGFLSGIFPFHVLLLSEERAEQGVGSIQVSNPDVLAWARAKTGGDVRDIRMVECKFVVKRQGHKTSFQGVHPASNARLTCFATRYWAPKS